MSGPDSVDRTQEYIDGHRVGYGNGYRDGKEAGFVDAKARVWDAVAAVSDAPGSPRVPARLLDALRTTIGPAPS